MNVLECSSIGDKRFSAFYAYVNFNGSFRSIEEHYQLSKRFNGEHAPTMRKAKGRKPSDFVVMGRVFDISDLTGWYYYLWYLYLSTNPSLVDYAKEFDDFKDRFKGRAFNCQADCVRLFVKGTEREYFEKIAGFINKLYSGNYYYGLPVVSKPIIDPVEFIHSSGDFIKIPRIYDCLQ